MKTRTKIAIATFGAAALVAGGVVTVANAAGGCKAGVYPLCANSVGARQVSNNSIPAYKIASTDRALFLKDTNTDVLGSKGPTLAVAITKIAKIGGSFSANATELGEVTFPAGVYDISASAVFDREDATKDGAANPAYVLPTTDLMPSFVLRFPGNAGTIMGAPISRAGYVELTGSSHERVTFTVPTKVKAMGFGYNENRSAEGANQISVSAMVTSVRVG